MKYLVGPRETDYTKALRKKQRFSTTKVSLLPDTGKGAMKLNSSYIFFSREGLSTDDVGVARGSVFREIHPWVGFKPDDIVQTSLGGLP